MGDRSCHGIEAPPVRLPRSAMATSVTHVPGPKCYLCLRTEPSQLPTSNSQLRAHRPRVFWELEVGDWKLTHSFSHSSHSAIRSAMNGKNGFDESRISVSAPTVSTARSPRGL